MKDYRQLQVWQHSHRLNLDVYASTAGFPKHEWYGLRSQIRRWAEGCGRRGDGDFYRFPDIAAGSASELDYHLLLARDLNYLPDSEYSSLRTELTRIRRMLTALLRKVDVDRLMAKR